MACYVSDEDDVPPLEDMSELLEQAKKIQTLNETKTEHKPSASANSTTTTALPPSDVTNNNASLLSSNHDNQASRLEEETKQSSQSTKSSGSFGGMKKGFLSGGSKKKSTPHGNSSASPSKPVQNEADAVPNPAGSADIPIIGPRKGSGDDKELKYRFDEVQEALRASAPLLENKDWLTDDLLANVEKQPRLARQLEDPRLAQAIHYFQRDPQQAMEMYRDDAEVQQFLRDFCSLLGSHFSSMGSSPDPPSASPTPDTIKTKDDSKKADVDIKVRSSTNPKQATADDEAKMQQILSDPEIKEIMTDKRIQGLFEAMRTNLDQGQRILQSASPELQSKINKLIQAGLLGFAS